MSILTQEQIASLTNEERLGLIDQLWESVDQDQWQFSLTPAQEQEVERRLAMLSSGECERIPLEVAMAELDRRCL